MRCARFVTPVTEGELDQQNLPKPSRRFCPEQRFRGVGGGGTEVRVRGSEAQRLFLHFNSSEISLFCVKEKVKGHKFELTT